MLVAIIGAGIMGACLAAHLCGDGITVLAFDEAGTGSGATGTSFACVNFFAGQSLDYMQFRATAMDYQRAFAQRLDINDIRQSRGSLRWCDDAPDREKLVQRAQSALHLGRVVEFLRPREAMTLEASLSISSQAEVVVRLPEEDWLDAPSFAKHVIEKTASSGMVRCISEKCTRIEPRNQCAIVWTNRTSYRVDVVILANGVGMGALLENLAIPDFVEAVPGVLASVGYNGGPVDHVVYANKLHFRADGPDRMLLGTSHDPDGLPDAGVAIKAAADTASEVSLHLKDRSFGNSLRARIGVRPVPKDGYPVIGRLPGQECIFVAVAHAAVTLAPYVTMLLAREILTGEESEHLAPFRPERFYREDLEDRPVGINAFHTQAKGA